MVVGFDFFSFSHFGPDSANSGIEASADHDAACLTGSNVSAGKDDIFLVLIDSTGIGDGFVVFDHRHGLTSQNRLINSQSCGHNSDDPNIGGNFVTN